jgi:hypothetical protein
MGRSRWRVAAYAGLAVLVLVNVALIGRLLGFFGDPWAHLSTGQASTSDGAGTPSDGATTGGATEAGTPTGAATATEADLVQERRLLAAADELTGWRATTGACGVPGALERTVDGGSTWEPVPVDLAPVTRLRILEDGTVAAVGGDAGCLPRYLTSTGEVWEDRPDLLVGSWYLMPAGTSRVMTPLGETDAPCAEGALDLVAVDASRAAALCPDGSVLRSVDSGASWAPMPVDGPVVAVGADSQGYVLAGRSPSCAGIAVTSSTPDGTTGTAAGCAPVAAADDEVAVARAGTAVWLWAAGETALSLDGGATW